MRVISLFQPWAQLIADRRVRLTTKPWPVEPGLLAIAAANRVNADMAEKYGYKPEELAQGAVIAFVEVTECLALPHPRVRESKFFTTFVDKDGQEHASAQEGRYAIRFKVLRKLRKPFGPVKGKFKVWEIPDEDLWGYIGTLSTTATPASKADGELRGASDAGNCSGSMESERNTRAISK